MDWLERERPTHPILDRVEIHVPDYRTGDGRKILLTRSGGGTYIAVFVFVDGTLAAVQVGCGVGIDPTMCFTAPPSSFGLSPGSALGCGLRNGPRTMAAVHPPARPRSNGPRLVAREAT